RRLLPLPVPRSKRVDASNRRALVRRGNTDRGGGLRVPHLDRADPAPSVSTDSSSAGAPGADTEHRSSRELPRERLSELTGRFARARITGARGPDLVAAGYSSAR